MLEIVDAEMKTHLDSHETPEQKFEVDVADDMIFDSDEKMSSPRPPTKPKKSEWE